MPLIWDVLRELQAVKAYAVIELGSRANDVDHDADIALQREVGC